MLCVECRGEGGGVVVVCGSRLSGTTDIGNRVLYSAVSDSVYIVHVDVLMTPGSRIEWNHAQRPF